MPTYIFKHPDKEIYTEIIQSMNEDHIFFDEDGLKWKRVWTNPQLNCEPNIDPFSNSDFIDKTGKMKGSYGDVQNYSRELSEKRASMNGGVDPVKENYHKKYSKERNGAKHLDQMKKHTIDNKNFKVTFD